MKAELRDSLENLFPDSVVGEKPCISMEIDVARGGTVAVHVLLTELAGGAFRLRVARSGEAVKEARWFRLIDVPVEENTGLFGFTTGNKAWAENTQNPHVVRQAPFRTYDAMEPLPAGEVGASGPTLAVRLHVPIKLDARVGKYDYVLTVEGDGGRAEFKLTVRIHKAKVRPVGEDSMQVTNWFSFENIAKRHGLELWSDAYWPMLLQYAKLMAHSRQNTFMLPLTLIFTKTPEGPVLEVKRLKRIVDIFTKAGLYYIEGGHVAGRTGGSWDAKTFDLGLAPVAATSVEGNAILASICDQLMDAMDKYGWHDRWIQHVTDEPIAANAADYRILTGMVRKYMPSIPILDATMDPKLVGSVDYWCPQVQEYQRHREEFEAQRDLGDQVWYYTCCFPGGPWLNRLLDQELLRPALLGWAGALFDLDGFLHWGFNHYRDDQDPFKMSVVPNWGGANNSLPGGDTHIAYPGKDGPWSSLRLESQREGFEDAELLFALKSRPAKAVLAMAVQGFDQHVKDVRTFRAARKALLEAADRVRT